MGKKGRHPLFTKSTKNAIEWMSEDDSGSEIFTYKTVRNFQSQQKQNASSAYEHEPSATSLDVIGNNDETESSILPLDEMLKKSNFREIFRKFRNKLDLNGNTIEKDLLEFLYKVYMENPTSRRCPDMNFESLTFHQPTFSIEEQLHIMEHDIKPCSVLLSRGNPLYSIEKKIYEDFRKKHPCTGDHLEFIEAGKLSEMTLEYLSHILPNIILMLDFHKMIPDRSCMDRNLEKLVEMLFDLLEKESSEEPSQQKTSIEESITDMSEEIENHTNIEDCNPNKDFETSLSQHVIIPNMQENQPKFKKPARSTIRKNIAAPCPKSVALRRKAASSGEVLLLEKEAILYVEIHNFQKQCTPATIIERYVHERKFSIDIVIETISGRRMLTLHGKDICSILDIPSSYWQVIRSMMDKIEENMRLDISTQTSSIHSKLLNNFANIISLYMKTMKHTNGIRYYTLWNWDIRSENQISVVDK